MANPFSAQCITDVVEPSEEDLDRYWGNFLYANSTSFVIADPKCGKTFFTIDLMMHLATNRNYLNYCSYKPINVLYINLDDPSNFWEKRLYDMRESFDGTLTNFYHIKLNKLDIMDHNDMNRLKDTIEELNSDIVILDTLRRVHKLDENKSENWTILKEKFDEIKDVNNNCLVLIHHLRKANKKPGAKESIFERMRGSGDILSLGNTFIGLEDVSSSNGRAPYVNMTYMIKNGPAEDGKMKLYFNEETLHYKKQSEQIIDTINDYILTNQGIAQSALIEHLVDNVYTDDRRTILRNLEKFCRNGRLKRCKNGRIWQYC